MHQAQPYDVQGQRRQLAVQPQQLLHEQWEDVKAVAQWVEGQRQQLAEREVELVRRREAVGEQERRLREAETRVSAQLVARRELERDVECLKDKNSRLVGPVRCQEGGRGRTGLCGQCWHWMSAQV